jgi:hypothetical protein
MKKEILHIGRHAIDVNVGTEEECEAATFVVCGPVSYFPDDVHTTCAWCQAPIVHRPHVPKTPVKICLACMTQHVQQKVN